MEKQQVKKIGDYVDKTLRENYIKNMWQGFEVCNQMVLDYINEGHDIDEVKNFCELNKKNRTKLIKNFTK